MLYKLICLSKKGIYFCRASAKQVETLKKKKHLFLIIRKEKLSLKKQIEIFDFLSLYYSEGENVYGLLLKYQLFADKKIKSICKFILAELRRGRELSQVFRDSRLFSEEVSSFLMIFKAVGTSNATFEKVALLLRLKSKKQKEVLKKSAYPILLLSAALGMIGFVSYSIIPNFLIFFQDSGTEIPLILSLISKEHLWKIVLFVIIFFLTISLIYKLIPINMRLKMPILSYFLKAKFQLFFWQLCLISMETGVSLEELIVDYLNREKRGVVGYALSTILSRLQRGLPFEEATDILLIEKKQRVLTTLATDNERKKQLYRNFILEAEEKNDEKQMIVANLVSSLAFCCIGLLILLLGYVMLIPLSQMSEIV